MSFPSFLKAPASRLKSLAIVLALASSLPPLARGADGATLCTDRRFTPAEAITALHAAAPSLRLGTPDAPRLVAPAYAEVRTAELARFNAELSVFLHGLGFSYLESPGFKASTPRFVCTGYAEAYLFLARVRHNREGDSSDIPAMFPVCFRMDPARRAAWAGPRASGPDYANHCVVMLLTDRGVIFRDPRLGLIVLSESERNSLYWPLR